jgi:hypothetical protein
MNESLELHDSTVSMVRAVGGDLIVSFSEAYVHRSFSVPGVSAGEGFVQPAELVFSLASWSGELSDALGDISDGHVSIGEQQLFLLPLPFASPSAVTAELVFASGALLKVSASSAVCRATGAARFVESYSG